MLKLTTDKHEASRGLSATAELLVMFVLFVTLLNYEDCENGNASKQCTLQNNYNAGRAHSI